MNRHHTSFDPLFVVFLVALAVLLAEGAVVMPLDIVTTEEDPWLAMAGMFRNNPLFDQWQAAIEENRRKLDEEGDPWLP